MVVETARQAIRTAREVMEEAGYSYSTVTSAERVEGTWVVEAETLAGAFVVEMDVETEEVTRYERVAATGDEGAQ